MRITECLLTPCLIYKQKLTHSADYKLSFTKKHNRENHAGAVHGAPQLKRLWINGASASNPFAYEKVDQRCPNKKALKTKHNKQTHNLKNFENLIRNGFKN